MRLAAARTAVLSLALAVFAASRAVADEPATGPLQPIAVEAFDAKVGPYLRNYCFSCHGEGETTGEISFDRFASADDVRGDHVTWERVLRALGNHEMPPPDEEQPSAEDTAHVVAWVQAELAKIDCSGPPNPGRVTMRRLNRFEYNNTIRDLVGVDFRPADDFPADDVGYGFDHIGDVLSLPPLLMEKYLRAAEQIATRAIIAYDLPQAPRKRIPVDELKVAGGDGEKVDGFRLLASAEETFRYQRFFKDGQYIVRARAFQTPAGDEPAKMALRLDGQDLKVFDVEATENDPAVFEAQVEIKEGRRRLGAAFLNDFYQPDYPDPNRRDRNLLVEYLELEGPLGLPEYELPESHRRIIFVEPKGGDEADCARRIFERFASRAFRRPATAAELDRLVGISEMVRADTGNFAEGIQVAMQAVLASPHFLFRVEQDARPGEGPRTLNDYELATRLSYFLWSSLPDDELTGLAARAELRPQLDAQIARMLADPKSQALIENFGSQWLQTRRLEGVTPDVAKFPTFTAELREAMRQETAKFFEHIVREDRSLFELIDADYTFVNDVLAKHYGLSSVEGPQFRQVSLSGTPRGGLLTQASILTITSNPTRTSPVKRGKWILEQILGTPPPPPPPGAGELSEEREAILSGSVRQRLERHRADPNCATCHQRMDPLGFAFENFDAIGGWRTKDGEFDIDPAGTLPDGRNFAGAPELRKILLGEPGPFRRNMVEKLLTYALGRGLENYDRCSVTAIESELEHNGDRFSALVRGIVHSAPFQKRQAPVEVKP
ncbi:MAG: DUF1592 domain-containing protein [Pirellulales bacterium]